VIRTSDIHRQLDILAFWNVMIAPENSPVFEALVDCECASKGRYVHPNRSTYKITPLGKQKAFL
tara:strand:+ start:10800 stop:10991 length:192 start_codon:yes stop_codon:yes gene_type:complete